jgi:transposase
MKARYLLGSLGSGGPPPACATTLRRRQLALKRTRVTGFEFTPTGIEIDVAPMTRVPYCSSCLRQARRVYDHRDRTWRHLDFAGTEVTLHYRQRRVDCRGCGGVRAELVPWASDDSMPTRLKPKNDNKAHLS